MADQVKLRIAGGVVAIVLVALVALSEPLTGIFRQTVLLNYLFLGILAAITVVAGAGLIVSLKSKGAGRSRSVIRTAAVIEVIFLVTVWVTVFATNAIESSYPTSPAGRLFNLER